MDGTRSMLAIPHCSMQQDTLEMAKLSGLEEAESRRNGLEAGRTENKGYCHVFRGTKFLIFGMEWDWIIAPSLDRTPENAAAVLVHFMERDHPD